MKRLERQVEALSAKLQRLIGSKEDKPTATAQAAPAPSVSRAAPRKRMTQKDAVSIRYDVTGRTVAWTDGCCITNPDGPGGWGVLLEVLDGTCIEGSGGDPKTTNNRMEMQAVIEAMSKTADADEVRSMVVRTDSQLVVLCAIGVWKRKSNLDLWGRFDRELRRIEAAGETVMFEWWKGHFGTAGNERADKLAHTGMRRQEPTWEIQEGGRQLAVG